MIFFNSTWNYLLLVIFISRHPLISYIHHLIISLSLSLSLFNNHFSLLWWTSSLLDQLLSYLFLYVHIFYYLMDLHLFVFLFAKYLNLNLIIWFMLARLQPLKALGLATGCFFYNFISRNHNIFSIFIIIILREETNIILGQAFLLRLHDIWERFNTSKHILLLYLFIHKH